MIRRPPRPPLVPSTTLFRSRGQVGPPHQVDPVRGDRAVVGLRAVPAPGTLMRQRAVLAREPQDAAAAGAEDRKSTRLNSSHANISFAVFCLKKKKYRNRRPSKAAIKLTIQSITIYIL